MKADSGTSLDLSRTDSTEPKRFSFFVVYDFYLRQQLIRVFALIDKRTLRTHDTLLG